MTVLRLFEYRAVLQRVIDGDTVELSVDLGFSTYRREIIRLYGINTPELNSKDPHERASAKAAKDYLTFLLSDEPLFYIRTHKDKTDKYGRMLAEIFLEDGTNVSADMIEEGYAQVYLP